jgi:hypothetical protein
MAMSDLFRRRAPAAQIADITPINSDAPRADEVRFNPTVESGRTGTLNIRGFLTGEEYNSDLKAPKQFAIYDRMLRSDPTVRATMLHVKTPIKAGEWEIRPASEEPIDLEIAAFVEHALFSWMETPWSQCLDDQLRYLDWGVQVLEEVYEQREVGWSYRLPGQDTPVEVPVRSVITWRKFGSRLPRTIWRWINDDNGELSIIQQRVYYGTMVQYRTVDLPVDKCLVLCNDKIGDDWWGQSILRGAYKPWWLLEAAQRTIAIGIERYLVGTPMARMSSNASDEQRSQMLQTLMQTRSGEKTAIVYSSQDGVDCDAETGDRAIWVMQPQHSMDVTGALGFVKHMESNIFTNIMARFMDLGQKETGARATAEIQDDPFYLGLRAVASQIVDAWNRGPIKRIVDLNYPNVTKYPELVVEKIAPIDTPIIAAAAQAYASAGFLTPDFLTEQWLRKQLGMPDKLIDLSKSDENDSPLAPATIADVNEPHPSSISIQKDAIDLAKKAIASGGQMPMLPKIPKPVKGGPAAPHDSGSGTSLSAAIDMVRNRMEREMQTAKDAGDMRALVSVRPKDLGLIAKVLDELGSAYSDIEAAKIGMQIHSEVLDRFLEEC